MRVEGERRERIYAVGCLLAAILLFGTVGGLDCDTISIEQGIWQTIWVFDPGVVVLQWDPGWKKHAQPEGRGGGKRGTGKEIRKQDQGHAG